MASLNEFWTAPRSKQSSLLGLGFAPNEWTLARQPEPGQLSLRLGKTWAWRRLGHGGALTIYAA